MFYLFLWWTPATSAFWCMVGKICQLKSTTQQAALYQTDSAANPWIPLMHNAWPLYLGYSQIIPSPCFLLPPFYRPNSLKKQLTRAQNIQHEHNPKNTPTSLQIINSVPQSLQWRVFKWWLTNKPSVQLQSQPISNSFCSRHTTAEDKKAPPKRIKNPFKWPSPRSLLP